MGIVCILMLNRFTFIVVKSIETDIDFELYFSADVITPIIL